MILFGGTAGELEIRRGGSGGFVVRGSFPYGAIAVLSDGGRRGRPRKERIAKGAFRYRVRDPQAEIHFLVGHSYDRVLASKLTRTLALEDTDEALDFEAEITPEVASTSHGSDAIKLMQAGLAVGISPGFRLPPERAVKNAETISEEPVDPASGQHGAVIRQVNAALLYELSVVTSAAYPQASVSQIEARSWELTDDPHEPSLGRALNRWRP